MRKWVTACLLAGGMVLGTWAMAFASGYEFFGTGIRALSMGGAFIGLADDSTATYWNPAGLAQLRGKGFEFDLERDSVDYGDNNSIRNLDPSLASLERNDVFLRWIPTEPDRFNPHVIPDDKEDIPYPLDGWSVHCPAPNASLL